MLNKTAQNVSVLKATLKHKKNVIKTRKKWSRYCSDEATDMLKQTSLFESAGGEEERHIVELTASLNNETKIFLKQ